MRPLLSNEARRFLSHRPTRLLRMPAANPTPATALTMTTIPLMAAPKATAPRVAETDKQARMMPADTPHRQPAAITLKVLELAIPDTLLPSRDTTQTNTARTLRSPLMVATARIHVDMVIKIKPLMDTVHLRLDTKAAPTSPAATELPLSNNKAVMARADTAKAARITAPMTAAARVLDTAAVMVQPAKAVTTRQAQAVTTPAKAAMTLPAKAVTMRQAKTVTMRQAKVGTMQRDRAVTDMMRLARVVDTALRTKVDTVPQPNPTTEPVIRRATSRRPWRPNPRRHLPTLATNLLRDWPQSPATMQVPVVCVAPA